MPVWSHSPAAIHGAALSFLDAMRPDLTYVANREIWAAWHGAGLNKGTPGEVACIRNLVGTALPNVDAAWRPALAGIGLRMQMQGVVCHGRPYVSYSGQPKPCELGDFLLVHDHTHQDGWLERSAVIVQAKVFHRSGGVGTGSRKPAQLQLYQRWPRFTYTAWPRGLGALASVHARAGLGGPHIYERELAVTGTRRRASPALLDEGCRYGMIDVEYSRWGDPQTGMNPWRLCSVQAPDVYGSKDGLTLGGYLVRLMMGRVGRPVPFTTWPASLSTACHWSLMVMDLLSLLPGAPASGSASATVAMLSAAGGGGSRGMAPSADEAGDLEEGGFAVIQVETSGRLPDRPRSVVDEAY